MKIDLNNGVIHIDLTEEFNNTNYVTKIYVDDINNKDILSNFDEKHSIVFKQNYSIEEPIALDITDYKLSAAVVTIFLHDDDGMLDTTLMHVVVDDEFIFYNMLNNILHTCNHCLKTTEKKRLLLCNLRWELLRYALKRNLIKDAIQAYRDLIRIIGIDDNPCDRYIGSEARTADFVWGDELSNTDKTSCPTCNNGVCSIYSLCKPCSNCLQCSRCNKADAPLHRWIDVY